jgi:hypothetical protein
MKIRNAHLKDKETSSAWGTIGFNSHGCAEVSDEAATSLLTVPGFSVCAECACATVPAKTPKKKKAE